MTRSRFIVTYEGTTPTVLVDSDSMPIVDRAKGSVALPLKFIVEASALTWERVSLITKR